MTQWPFPDFYMCTRSSEMNTFLVQVSRICHPEYATLAWGLHWAKTLEKQQIREGQPQLLSSLKQEIKFSKSKVPIHREKRNITGSWPRNLWTAFDNYIPLAFLQNLVTFPQLFLFVQIQKHPGLATSLKLCFIKKAMVSHCTLIKGVCFHLINGSYSL